MGNFIEVNTPPSQEEMVRLEKQLSSALGKERAPSPGFVAKAVNTGGFVDVTIRDGKETVTTHTKPLNGNTAYAVQPTRPGHVVIPGYGETTIAAAICAGVLPEGWTPERGFDKPAEGKAGNLAGNQNQAARSNDTDKQAEVDAPGITPAMKASVEEASRVLDRADQTIGADLTTHHLSAMADSGIISAEGLPEGISEADVQRVYAGFVAQSNAALAEVGASVPMLQEMLDNDQLRVARQAAVGQNGDVLKQLGEIAHGRLAKLPETNPEAFAEMVAGMSEQERAVLHRNKDNGHWTVRIPGKPEMSFALAVRRGIVRF